MSARTFGLCLLLWPLAAVAGGQSPPKVALPGTPPVKGEVSSSKWRPAGERTKEAPAPAAPLASDALAPSRTPIARFTTGTAVLPADHGQVWRDYDISPYTSRITTTQKPEQAVVDWILRETGAEVWFAEPLGFMSADRRTLRVYHTPEMHKVVASVVDRFVASEGQVCVLSVHLVTVGNPGWRGKVYKLLKPVEVQSSGVEAWLTSKENAAVLLGELKKRPDFREHNSPHMAIPSGQSQTISRMKPRQYLKAGLAPDPARPGSEVEAAQIDEGFSLQLSPLYSADGKALDAALKCQVDQVEKLIPVYLEPASPRTTKKTQIQIPQVVSWRLNERFRWPADQVLVISSGMVAAPTFDKPGALEALAGAAGRAEALVFIGCLGKAEQPTPEAARNAGAAGNRGRY